MVLDSDVLPRIRPMRLRLVKEPFDSPDYISELKQDGFRATAYIDQGGCRLESRNLKSLPFKSLGASLAVIYGDGLPKLAVFSGFDTMPGWCVLYDALFLQVKVLPG